jgi:hypothetical protein
MATATKAEQNGAAATDAAVAQVDETVAASISKATAVANDFVTRTTDVITPAVEAATDKAKELTEAYAVDMKKAAGETMDAFYKAVHQYLDFTIQLADAVKVDWVGELTRSNAKFIGDLVAVSENALHDLLK